MNVRSLSELPRRDKGGGGQDFPGGSFDRNLSFCLNCNATFGAAIRRTEGRHSGKKRKGAHVQFPIARQGLVRGFPTMANDKAKKKATKKVEKAVRKAVKKGVTEDAVEKAVSQGMANSTKKKPVGKAAAAADAQEAKTA